MKRLGIIFNLLLLLAVFPAYAQQTIKIIDLNGKTQSVVELDDTDPEKMTATVRVALLSSDPNVANAANDELKGVDVSLIKVVNEREGDVVQTARTFKNGVATFNSIPPGIYMVRIECAQMNVNSVTITGADVINRATMPDAPDPKSLDQVHLLDLEGQTKAMAEIPFGKTVDIEMRIIDTENKDASLNAIRVLLIDLEEDTEEEIEVFSGQITDDKGVVHFTQVPGGLYRVRVECPRYAAGGIGFNSASVLSCICPTDIITGAPAMLAELAAAPTVTTGATLTTTIPAALSSPLVVAPAAVVTPVVVKDELDNNSPSGSTLEEGVDSK